MLGATAVRAFENQLSWDLASSIEYQAGAEFRFTLHLSAPGAGGFYLLGALYSPEGVYLPGTTFGVVVDDEGYGVASVTSARLWSLTEGQDLLLPCRFVFDRTGVVLGLFLMRLSAKDISLEDDAVEGQLAVALATPVPPVEVIAGVVSSFVLLAGVTAIMMEVFYD